MPNIEIMSPAGSFESLNAAIKAGADSVYFGVEQLNMRARAANNFTLADLGEIVKTCKEKNVKTYLTLNTIMYDHDIILMKKICDAAKKEGVSAVIASDISAISYANSIGLEVHISTQQNVSNMEAVRFYAKFADVIVLARELTLSQVKKICDDIKKENIDLLNGETKNPGGGCLDYENKIKKNKIDIILDDVALCTDSLCEFKNFSIIKNKGLIKDNFGGEISLVENCDREGKEHNIKLKIKEIITFLKQTNTN